MWMAFTSHTRRPWAIRPFFGGVNGISGDVAMGDMASLLKRMNTVSAGQDYIVLPQQKWLDGIATQPGIVKQFVSAQMEAGARDNTRLKQTGMDERYEQPLKKPADLTSDRKVGSSLEWQLTGRDSVGGIQLQIIPAHDTTRIHFGNVPDWLHINREWTSYKTQVPADARTYDVFKTPKELGLKIGDVIHVKDLLNREEERPKVVEDLLKESPVALEEADSIDLEPIHLEPIDMKLSPGPFNTDIIYVKSLTGRQLRIGLDLTDTVLELKYKVQDEEGIPPDQQRLFICHGIMEKPISLENGSSFEEGTVKTEVLTFGRKDAWSIQNPTGKSFK
jgi:hypothetical protein